MAEEDDTSPTSVRCQRSRHEFPSVPPPPLADQSILDQIIAATAVPVA
jgi:hypothetical protein